MGKQRDTVWFMERSVQLVRAGRPDNSQTVMLAASFQSNVMAVLVKDGPEAAETFMMGAAVASNHKVLGLDG